VIVLPPRLDTVLAVTLCLVEPFADRLSGREARAVWRRGPLTRKLSSSIGLTELALVRETMGGLEPLGAGSLTLGALANADGFLVIAPESEGFQAGDVVEARGL
jgi:molybdopterin biosynthesis enzyme